jgi:hypothetical protein
MHLQLAHHRPLNMHHPSSRNLACSGVAFSQGASNSHVSRFCPPRADATCSAAVVTRHNPAFTLNLTLTPQTDLGEFAAIPPCVPILINHMCQTWATHGTTVPDENGAPQPARDRCCSAANNAFQQQGTKWIVDRFVSATLAHVQPLSAFVPSGLPSTSGPRDRLNVIVAGAPPTGARHYATLGRLTYRRV